MQERDQSAPKDDIRAVAAGGPCKSGVDGGGVVEVLGDDGGILTTIASVRTQSSYTGINEIFFSKMHSSYRKGLTRGGVSDECGGHNSERASDAPTEELCDRLDLGVVQRVLGLVTII